MSLPSALPGAAAAPLTASQANALLRAAGAIEVELLGAAFPALVERVEDALAGRWDFGPGSPMVQHLLTGKAEALRGAFLARLGQRQDEALGGLAAGRSGGPTLALDADALSLADLPVDDRGSALSEACARRLEGLVEVPLRELNVVVGHVAGRSNLRTVDNPFGPFQVTAALLAAAEDVSLHPEGWSTLLGSFEKPLGEDMVRVTAALLDHFRRHGHDARSIRRSMTPRAMVRGGVAVAGPLPGGLPGAAPVTGMGSMFGRGATFERVPRVPGSLAEAPGGFSGGAGDSTGRGAGSGGGGADGGTGGPGRDGGQGGAGGAAGLASMAAALAASAAGRGGPVIDPGAVLNDLLVRLQANARDLRMPNLPASQPMEPSLFAAITDLQQLGLEGIHGALFAGTPAGSINAWREHLIAQSSRTVDKLTIELVGLMFDQVLRDKQLPSEIKALLSRLQFPVLKAALLDAAFFASSAHPARRLIDRIASASLGWEPYGDENRRFHEEVDRIVREALAKFTDDVAVFEQLLTEFDAFLGEIKPRDSDPVARAKRALEEAEKREILVINTTIQVRRAFERVELEPYLRDFLVGPWVQVLVTATLRDGQTRGFSRSFREAIHELVWSVQPKATAEERRRLVELIPPLTRVLRDGLALIRMSERDQDEFLKQLMASHAMSVKPVDQATYIRHSLAASELRAKLDGIQMTGGFPMATVPGGIRVPTGALMALAAEHHAELTVPDPLTDVPPSDRNEDARSEQRIAGWVRGTWFELWDGKKFIKARLRWISPLRTLFMFSAAPDNKAHVMPPDLIRAYLRRGYIREMESMPLTRRAVDRVVADFERSPARASEMVARYTQPASA